MDMLKRMLGKIGGSNSRKNELGLKVGRLKFCSGHPILNQVAKDILAGIDKDELPDRDITVWLGAHKRFKKSNKRNELVICVQTEIFFDAFQKPMWRSPRWTRILLNLMKCDIFLDFSASNEKAYRWLPSWLKNKICYGPKIFPSKPMDFLPGPGRAIFFGTMNDRRRNILNKFPNIKTLPEETFGAQLDEELSKAPAIVNLHYHDGIYSEYPRLLTAFLAGKTIISERLGPDLILEKHYLSLGTQLDDELLETTYKNFANDFAAHNKFTDFLKQRAVEH
jgi:hypothetical protein